MHTPDNVLTQNSDFSNFARQRAIFCYRLTSNHCTVILCSQRPKFQRMFAIVDPKSICQGVTPVNLLTLMKPDRVFVREGAPTFEMHIAAYNYGDIMWLEPPAWGATFVWDSGVL